MNVIRGHGTPTPPDSNKGHFHIDFSEFWVIAEGTVDYKMEGMPFFTANVGDVVYAPQGRWHRASWAGNGMSTRIAINPSAPMACTISIRIRGETVEERSCALRATKWSSGPSEATNAASLGERQAKR